MSKQLEDLIPDSKRMTAMPFDDLMNKIKGIREARITVTTNTPRKPRAKQKAAKTEMQKILEAMSPEEREAFMKSVEG